MNISFIKIQLITSLLVLPALVFAMDTPIIQKHEYEIADLKKLSLSFAHTQLTVNHKQGDRISIVHSQTLSKGDPEKCLYEIVSDSNGEHLELENKKSSELLGFFGLFENCNVTQSIKIDIGDAAFQAFTLALQHGELALDKSQYPYVKLDLSHSKADINTIKSNNTFIELAHSRVNVDQIQAKQASVSGAHSSFTVSTFMSEKLNSDWTHSQVTFNHSAIEQLSFENSHSPINLSDHQGKNLSADLSHSTLYANTAITGKASIESGHGNVEFIGAANQLNVDNAHGYVQLTQLTTEPFDISVENRHGNTLISVPENSTYNYHLVNGNKEQVIENASQNNIHIDSKHGNVKIKNY
jgi:hypothetical protein